MRRGAFTLLEVLIVVALVVAISAVALPSLATRVAAGRAGFALRALESAAALARADAMSRGRIMTLVAEPVGDEWVLLARPIEAASVATPPAENGAPPERTPARGREYASFSGVTITGVLPEPAEFTPDAGSESPDSIDGGSGLETFADAGEAAPALTIGTFFPDGSCRPGPLLYLISQDGLRQSVRLLPLTARVEARSLPPAEVEARRREEASEPDPLLPLPAEDEP